MEATPAGKDRKDRRDPGASGHNWGHPQPAVKIRSKVGLENFETHQAINALRAEDGPHSAAVFEYTLMASSLSFSIREEEDIERPP